MGPTEDLRWENGRQGEEAVEELDVTARGCRPQQIEAVSLEELLTLFFGQRLWRDLLRPGVIGV